MRGFYVGYPPVPPQIGVLARAATMGAYLLGGIPRDLQRSAQTRT